MQLFGWDVRKFEKESKWCFVDASSSFNNETRVVSEYNPGALLAGIGAALIIGIAYLSKVTHVQHVFKPVYFTS